MSVSTKSKTQEYRRRRVDGPRAAEHASACAAAVAEQPEPGRRRLATPSPSPSFSRRDAWLVARAISGVEGEELTANIDAVDLLSHLRILPLDERGKVFRSWVSERPDVERVRQFIADASPTLEAVEDEPEVDDDEEPEAGADELEAGAEESSEEEFDPHSLEAVRAAREDVELTDFEIGVADETLAILTRDSDLLYQKDGAIVRVVRTPKEGSMVAAIGKMSEANIREEITHRIRFYKLTWPPKTGDAVEDAKRKPVKETKNFPNYLAKAIIGRGEYPGIRPLDRITTSPVFRADGSIITSPGYDPDSWVFHEPDAEYPEIPSAPTREDAEAALREIMELVDEFPWVGPRDKSVWFAGLLTMVGRDLFAGPAPLFALDGNQRGVGKGLLTDVASLIATGRRAPSGVSMRGRDDDDELRKVIDSFAMSNASGMLLFDNLSGPIGGAVLDSAITSGRRAGRKLGGNELFDVEQRITYWANGNNLSTTGDASRRALIAKLFYGEEHAAEGRTFSIENLIGYVEEHRPRLYVSAMVILREFILAGRPRSAKTLGSFEEWSWTIASAVARITGYDPIDAVAHHVIDDPQDEVNGAILAGFYSMLASKGELKKGLKAATIISRIKAGGFNGQPEHPELADALSEIAPGGKDLPNGRILARRFRTIVDQPIGGLILRKSGVDRTGIVRWTVERVGQSADHGEGIADTIPFQSSSSGSPSNGPASGNDEVAK